MWTGFQRPKRLAVDSSTLTEVYGSFSAQPFERGFATTIGNSLRRALMGSIQGAAITAVRFEGVEHEFSPIPGVVEDATDIILNLRQIPLRLHGDGPRTMQLRVTEPGEVYSGNIEVGSEVVILDPDVYIATVSDEGKLGIEMRVKQGRGYVSAERNHDDDLDIGYIPVDSVHSPISKVQYEVKQARLGQDSRYEQLSVELWTNGAVEPQDAIGLAAKLIKDHMQIFITFEEEDSADDAALQLQGDQYAEHLNRSVEELELSVRAYNCLKNASIQTIGDLVVKTENDMMKTKNFGKKSLEELKDILGGLGLEFGMVMDEHGGILPKQSLGE